MKKQYLLTKEKSGTSVRPVTKEEIFFCFSDLPKLIPEADISAQLLEEIAISCITTLNRKTK